MSAVGLAATPNEKLFIFDIQNAMAGLFFFHHHLRGEKGREEGKGDRDRCAPIPGTHSSSLLSPSITLSLSLAALPSIRRPFKSGSSCDSPSLLRLGKRFLQSTHFSFQIARALLAASADSNFIKMFYHSNRLHRVQYHSLPSRVTSSGSKLSYLRLDSSFSSERTVHFSDKST